MSVINTMLKDLESRGVECNKSGDAILGGLSANKPALSEESLSANIYFISLLSVFFVIAVIVAVYYLSPYKMVSIAQQETEQLATSNISSIAVENINDKKAVLTDNSVLIERGEVTETRQAAVKPSPLTSITENKNRLVAAKAEVPSTVKAAPSVTTVRSFVEPSNVTQKTPVEDQPKKIKTVATQPVVEKQVQSIIKQPAGLAEVEATVAEDMDDSADLSQSVTKTQREYTAQEKSQQAYAAASSLYNKGNKQQAKTSLIEALAFNQGNKDAHVLLAIIYLEDGRADLASESIEKGLLIHSKDQTLNRLYLQSLVQEAKYKEAIAVMEHRLRLTSPEDLGYLAGLYQKQNDHLSAVKFYSQALQLKPSTSLWWMGQGISLEGIEKYEQALQSYQQSISTGQLSGKLAQYAISRMKAIKQLHADLVS